jgi:ornithine cyclodeaminase/alanine dehydrogenase-like protein (mu-crystallin family)
VETARDAVEGSDIVTTITSAREPVLEGAWLEAGAHVNAAGSNSLQRREVDDTAVERSALVVADSPEQAKMESGDLDHAVASGVLHWNDVLSLAEIVAGETRGRTSPDQITLFESQGLAVEDVAVARFIYDRARSAGAGIEVPFEGRA